MSTEDPKKELKDTRILIVDDSTAIISIIRWMARSFGVTDVREADNAESGFSLLMTKPPDLIFIDINLPGEDGFAFVNRVRKSDKPHIQKTPMIIITGDGTQDNAQRAIKTGADYFLVKPFSAQVLKCHIERCIYNPLPYIDVGNYKGPCRRRKINPNYKGAERRAKTQAEIEKEMSEMDDIGNTEGGFSGLMSS